MVEDRLQLQRFELKYVVSEEVALAVRDFISPYLRIDEYGATQPNLSYSVHSLYLDGSDLPTYWQTINGDKNRYKLRLRFYENRPAAPVFFEIKRRTNDAISKQRGAVRREAVDWLLGGQLPEPGHLLSSDPKHLVAVQKFCQIMTQLRARPTAHVCYLREAWISPENNSVRVTMDRSVRAEPEPAAALSAEMRNPVLVFGSKVVLELKFTARFPDWFRELVRVYGLVQSSAAKYADGVALIGEARFSEAGLASRDGVALARQESRRAFLQKQSRTPLFQTAA